MREEKKRCASISITSHPKRKILITCECGSVVVPLIDALIFYVLEGSPVYLLQIKYHIFDSVMTLPVKREYFKQFGTCNLVIKRRFLRGQKIDYHE
jgi:hypothetical protein